MTSHKVDKMCPSLSIRDIINDLSLKELSPPLMVVRSPIFLHSLLEMLAATMLEVLEAFSIWKAAQGLASRIEHPAPEPLKHFQAKLGGRPLPQPEERWKVCIQVVNKELPWIVSSFYVQKKLPPTVTRPYSFYQRTLIFRDVRKTLELKSHR